MASKFLTSQGMSLDELDSLKDTSALTLDFEEFMLDKYQDPEISTPKQEERAESLEVQQRLEEIVNSDLKYKASGYPLKDLNQDFEDIAYQSAIRSLALSEDEITQENLEKHITQQSNRVATEYYSGIWAAQQPEKKLTGHTIEHYANIIDSINQMVEQKQTKEQIYNNLLGDKNHPSVKTEKDVTNLVINTNTAPISSWLKKMGKTGAKFLDRMQKLEIEYPLASLAANVAVGSVAAPALMAYRMSMASRNIYKMSKESGMSIGQMLKDKDKRKELLSHSKAFARIIPGASIFLSADALKKHFSKEGRKSLVKTLANSGKAIKTLWQTKGRDKQAWKDLGKGAATIGGIALTVTAVAGFASNASANETSLDNTHSDNDVVNHNTVLQSENVASNYQEMSLNNQENVIDDTVEHNATEQSAISAREQRQEERTEAREQRQEARQETREQKQETRAEAQEQDGEDNTDKNNYSQGSDKGEIKKHYEDLIKQGKTSEAMKYLQEMAEKANQDLSSAMDRAREYHDNVMDTVRAYHQDTMDKVDALDKEASDLLKEHKDKTDQMWQEHQEKAEQMKQSVEDNRDGSIKSHNGQAVEHIQNLRGLGGNNHTPVKTQGGEQTLSQATQAAIRANSVVRK